ncbi:hypothetical protein MANAM107_15940 [Actinomyces capricornis]|uniref:Uncharacterized protein n=1 Tax=Actinomyces capricornis TaxID=2755559 RepID=A0ABM7UN32_9ACTO|nr:hypothetical protein MANAM107_15940 [Actinomyces capricornis]
MGPCPGMHCGRGIQEGRAWPGRQVLGEGAGTELGVVWRNGRHLAEWATPTRYVHSAKRRPCREVTSNMHPAPIAEHLRVPEGMPLPESLTLLGNRPGPAACTLPARPTPLLLDRPRLSGKAA